MNNNSPYSNNSASPYLLEGLAELRKQKDEPVINYNFEIVVNTLFRFIKIKNMENQNITLSKKENPDLSKLIYNFVKSMNLKNSIWNNIFVYIKYDNDEIFDCEVQFGNEKRQKFEVTEETKDNATMIMLCLGHKFNKQKEDLAKLKPLDNFEKAKINSLSDSEQSHKTSSKNFSTL